MDVGLLVVRPLSLELGEGTGRHHQAGAVAENVATALFVDGWSQLPPDRHYFLRRHHPGGWYFFVTSSDSGFPGG